MTHALVVVGENIKIVMADYINKHFYDELFYLKKRGFRIFTKPLFFSVGRTGIPPGGR